MPDGNLAPRLSARLPGDQKPEPQRPAAMGEGQPDCTGREAQGPVRTRGCSHHGAGWMGEPGRHPDQPLPPRKAARAEGDYFPLFHLELWVIAIMLFL